MAWLRELWTQIWITLVVAAVSLALYTSAGRQLIPLIETYKPDIEQQLSSVLKQPVVIGQLRGGWSRLSPQVTLSDVQLGPAGDGLHIDRMEAELDVSASLFYRLPVFRRIEVSGISAEVHQRSKTDWQIGSQWPLSFAPAAQTSAIPSTTGKPLATEQPLWLTWLSLQQTIVFSNWQLVAFDADNTREELAIEHLRWRNRGDNHELDGHLAWGREQLASVSVMASLDGDLWPWKDQSGEVYLDVESQEWSRWIPAELPDGLSVERLTAGARAWLSIRDGDMNALHLDADIPELKIHSRAQTLSLTGGKLSAGGRHNGDDWHLLVSPVFNEPLPLQQVSLSAISLAGGKGWQLGIPQLDLTAARQFLLDYQLLPAPFDRYVEATQASGQASQVRLSLLPGEHPQIDVRASLQEVSTVAYQGIPAFSGVSAALHLQPSGGVLTVQDDAFAIHLEGIYDQPWQLRQPSGRFYWALHPDYAQLQVHGLKAELEQTTEDGQTSSWPLAAELALALPLHHSTIEPAMSLLVGTPSLPVSLRGQLVPSVLDDGIRSWIRDSLLDGQLNDGAFVMHSVLSHDHPANSQTTQLYLNFDKARVRYLTDWPEMQNLSGRLLLRAPELDVRLDEGRTLGGTLSGRSGRIQIGPDARGKTHLNVNARIEGDSEEALQYLTATPLAAVVNHALDDWQAHGPMKAHLLLDMPLGQAHAEPKVQLDADIHDNQLTLDGLRLNFSNLKGNFHYNSEFGLTSDWLEGDIFAGHFSAGIDSKARAGGFDMVLTGKGNAQLASFREWMPSFLLEPVSGQLDYDARLVVGSNGVKFSLESGLTGTAIDLPAPIGKSAAEQRSLQVDLTPGQETRINMNYANRVRMALALGDDGVDRGQVYLGDSEPFLPGDKGIEIRGQVPETLNAADWWAAWQKLMAAAAAASPHTAAKTSAGERQTSGPVRSIDVSIGDVDAWGTVLGPTHVLGSQQWNEWEFNVASTLVQGNVQLKPGAQPIGLNLDYVHLPAGAEEDTAQETAAQDSSVADNSEATSAALPVIVDKPDPLAALQPADIPAIDLKLGELYIGSRNYGRWQLSSRPLANGVAVKIVDSDMKSMVVRGDMQWLRDGAQHRTVLDVLNISSKDVGRIQRSFRQDAVIEGKDMTSTLQLSWQGSPMAYNSKTLNGLASVRIKDGTMVAEGTGALKAFGALNFNSVARRLKLDFSDLYQSGVAFDTLKAKAKIDNGLLTLTEPLSLDGPGAKFLTTGSTNLVDETLDMKLVVTFPVSSTLPMVALLAGLAPPVAASIYVTEKLIGDELARFTSASYDLKGSWQKPDLKINQAFDNNVDGKKDRGLWERIKSIIGLDGDD